MTLRLAPAQGEPATPDRAWTRTVHHGGRAYVATATMAAIFEAHAADVVARGETELVPLLHRDGVELLLIGPHTRYTVVGIDLGITSARDRRPSAPPRPTTDRSVS